MDLFSRRPAPNLPLPGTDYLKTLHKYLRTNLPRLAPTAPPPATLLQQSYTLLTLGLDPSSQPLSRALKVPLTLGFGQPSQSKSPVKPLLLRLPPDRLLYLLLRWQALPQQPPHVGRTDVPIEEGVPYAARGATGKKADKLPDGDVQSVRSWVGSMRSVSMGGAGSLAGWWGKEEPSEDQLLLELYSMFTVLPALLIHPPFYSDPPIADLVDVGGYTQLGGVDVRVPLDVLRNLQILELEGYDPRALLIPPNPNLRSLTIRDVQDADDWLEQVIGDDNRFPNLRHLSLHSTTLLSFPTFTHSLSRLTSLDLSHNLLNAIPPALSSLSSLASLNLSHNLITSLRAAPSALGYITSLNLAHNRIDCLVGLERVLGLERVDVRHNEIQEYGEVGRLAVLPHIRQVWCARNPLVEDATWRVKLGTTFAVEGREVVLDDTPFSWTEQRAIDTELGASGKRRPRHDRHPTTPAAQPAAPRVATSAAGVSPLPRRAPAFADTSVGSSRAASNVYRDALGLGGTGDAASAGVAATRSAAQPASASSTSMSAAPLSPAPSSIQAKHKRRPRRVINLDSNEGLDEIKGGSMRLPPKTRMSGGDRDGEVDEQERGSGAASAMADAGENGNGDGNGNGNGNRLVPKRTGGRRARVSASLFEPH